MTAMELIEQGIEQSLAAHDEVAHADWCDALHEELGDSICVVVTMAGSPLPQPPAIVAFEHYMTMRDYAATTGAFTVDLAAAPQPKAQDHRYTTPVVVADPIIREHAVRMNSDDARWHGVDSKVWVCDATTKRTRFES